MLIVKILRKKENEILITAHFWVNRFCEIIQIMTTYLRTKFITNEQTIFYFNYSNNIVVIHIISEFMLIVNYIFSVSIVYDTLDWTIILERLLCLSSCNAWLEKCLLSELLLLLRKLIWILVLQILLLLVLGVDPLLLKTALPARVRVLVT